MTRQELIDFIMDYLASLMDMPREDFEVDVPLARYGIDSTATVGLSGELSDRLGLELSPDVVYDHPTIAAIADHVLSMSAVQA